MKKLLIILCLLTFALPTYATFGYYEGCNDNKKPYDDSELQEYAQKLEKEYWDRVNRGECEINDMTYTHYVRYPVFKYIEEHPINYSESDD